VPASHRQCQTGVGVGAAQQQQRAAAGGVRGSKPTRALKDAGGARGSGARVTRVGGLNDPAPRFVGVWGGERMTESIWNR